MRNDESIDQDDAFASLSPGVPVAVWKLDRTIVLGPVREVDVKGARLIIHRPLVELPEGASDEEWHAAERLSVADEMVVPFDQIVRVHRFGANANAQDAPGTGNAVTTTRDWHRQPDGSWRKD